MRIFRAEQTLRSVKVASVVVPAPPDDAPAQQWLDFAALAGVVAIPIANGQWGERIGRAYLEKWAPASP